MNRISGLPVGSLQLQNTTRRRWLRRRGHRHHEVPTRHPVRLAAHQIKYFIEIEQTLFQHLTITSGSNITVLFDLLHFFPGYIHLGDGSEQVHLKSSHTCALLLRNDLLGHLLLVHHALTHSPGHHRNQRPTRKDPEDNKRQLEPSNLGQECVKRSEYPTGDHLEQRIHGLGHGGELALDHIDASRYTIGIPSFQSPLHHLRLRLHCGLRHFGVQPRQSLVRNAEPVADQIGGHNADAVQENCAKHEHPSHRFCGLDQCHTQIIELLNLLQLPQQSH
mmetsp:Transcript_48998/g.106709  ORF Transcript_48998/g.106709 Transcript_48998/m.106709 type:complete len:277 (-) Transcript_48998:556-1386(-)